MVMFEKHNQHKEYEYIEKVVFILDYSQDLVAMYKEVYIILIFLINLDEDFFLFVMDI